MTGSLLDTNIVSEPLRPRPDPEVLREMEAHAGEMALPSVVWHEPRFGGERLRPPVAAVNSLTLVTRTPADFRMDRGLDVESWFGRK